MENFNDYLQNLSQEAKKKDDNDILKAYKNQFSIPQLNGKDVVYFSGNSLGLSPKKAQAYVQNELQNWQNLGVEGHFTGEFPWATYEQNVKEGLAKIVGAKPSEVAAMGSLTSNLHFLMATFYRPHAKKFKILVEKNIFSSDAYIVQSQAEWHGFDAKYAIIYVEPNENHILEEKSTLEAIATHHESLALILLGGVNFISGQALEMNKICAQAKKYGITIGFDLAHAVGNIPLSLHDWGIDFAAWCSYKYLNAGPGAIAGIFVHEKHHTNTDLKILKGWWGNRFESRFNMNRIFEEAEGADKWQLSNPDILSLASLRASIEIFSDLDFDIYFAKSNALFSFLFDALAKIKENSGNAFQIITPFEDSKHGCQVSIKLKQAPKLLNYLHSKNIIADLRKPDIIRFAPVPLYNSFEDISVLVLEVCNFFKELVFK